MNAPTDVKAITEDSALPHESAMLHVSGEAVYIDDMPELAGTLHAALGLSSEAHARIESIDLDAVLASPGVVAVLRAEDIPGRNDCGPIIHDDPILACDEVLYVGQPVFVVIAKTYDQARRAARQASIRYSPLPALLTVAAARDAGSFVLPPMRLSVGSPEQCIAEAPHRLSGKLSVGGQEHFYLEGQIAYAAPLEDGGIRLWSSTQHPSEMQLVVAHALGIEANRVMVEMRRMGGGFGGKESQSALIACVSAIACERLRKPVKLRLDRDDDFMVTGKRHDFEYTFEAGFDDEGRIHGARVDMTARAGFSADLSGPVATRAICHFDNAYYLSDVDIQAFCARTHTQSNTAFRGFGGPQGAIAIEYILDSVAHQLGLDPLEVKRRNFYGVDQRNRTPYGQVVEDNILHDLVSRLEHDSDYAARRRDIANWNTQNPVLKRGIALTPVKFGISFNLTHLNQAGALVHVYTDGSVLVNHGGTEMGQGLHTKVCQVVAKTLGVSPSRVRISATDTSKVANTSATAASTGADLNGKAAEAAALRIRQRLTEFACQRYGGVAANFAGDRVIVGDTEIDFNTLVAEAYANRVQLWSDGFYATPGLHWDRETLTGKPFHYFAYGAAVSEVVIDTLTGESRLLRADLLHDAGQSINPAIDIGQIEGAFIQGMGWLTMEELHWNESGRLTTHAPSTYKIPAVSDCPAILKVSLFEVPNRADTIFRSKAVGEPPLLLAFSVFFAIRDAISAAAGGGVPPLRAPATPEAILYALVSMQQGQSG